MIYWVVKTPFDLEETSSHKHSILSCLSNKVNRGASLFIQWKCTAMVFFFFVRIFHRFIDSRRQVLMQRQDVIFFFFSLCKFNCSWLSRCSYMHNMNLSTLLWNSIFFHFNNKQKNENVAIVDEIWKKKG